MGSHLPHKSNASLVERLLSAPGMVSVIHAPAGYGKTVLLEDVRLALSQRGAAVVHRLEDAAATPHFPWLLLDSDGPLSFDAEQLRQGLDAALLSHTGIIIATRRIETLPIARLRAEGRVLRFGSQQIGISRRDAISVLRTSIDRKTAEWLADLADGWSVAISLFLDHAHDSGARFAADGNFIEASGLSAYIDQEILVDLPSDWASALRFASIADSSNAAMLDFIRPHDDLGRHLISLHERLPGLVTSIDGQTSLNPLLRLHMARQFEQLPRPERGDALERAAQRCARIGRVAEAASLVTRVGSPDAIVDFVRRSEGLRLWVTGGFDVVREVVNQAGARGVEDEPRLKLLKCLVHLKVGEIDDCERLLNEVTPRLAGDHQAQRDASVVRTALQIYGCRSISDDDLAAFRKFVLRGGEDAAWQSLILSMQSMLEIQRGDLDAGVAVIVEATRHTNAARAEYGQFFLDIHSANIALARGDVPRARTLLGQIRKVWRQKFPSDVGLQTIHDALSASLEFEAGRLSSARLHMRRSMQSMPHVEAWLDIYAAAYEPMARLLVSDVGLPSTTASLGTQQEALIIAGLPRIARMVKALEICLKGEALLRSDSVDPLVEDLRVDEPVPSLSWQERELFAMVEAYKGLCTGLPQGAVDALNALINFAEPRGLLRSVLRAKLLLVAAFDRQGHADQAERVFQQALLLGSSTGMSRAFAEIGGGAVSSRCKAQIARLRAGNIADPKMVRLLRMIARWENLTPSASVTKFTPREIDVLGALEQGGADKLIGRRLGITEHAVRYHLKNIYRKLGVNDRLGAIAQAREAGFSS
jgi:LuxR family maltose regulon positive regulatory protein